MGLTGGQAAPSSIGQSRDPRRLVTEVLKENDGNMLRTAQDLGVGRKTLYRYVERLSLWPVVDRLRDEARARKARRQRGLP
jgi:DNA-binding NtrC family response regulator